MTTIDYTGGYDVSHLNIRQNGSFEGLLTLNGTPVMHVRQDHTTWDLKCLPTGDCEVEAAMRDLKAHAGTLFDDPSPVQRFVTALVNATDIKVSARLLPISHAGLTEMFIEERQSENALLLDGEIKVWRSHAANTEAQVVA